MVEELTAKPKTEVTILQQKGNTEVNSSKD